MNKKIRYKEQNIKECAWQYTVDLNIKIGMTVQERNVQIGCTWLTCSSNLKKINKKIRYQNTESVVCKWHCQYEVDNNECEYLTDC